MGQQRINAPATTRRRLLVIVVAGVLAAVMVETRPAAAVSSPKSGAACKRSQVGLAAANGLVCTKVGKAYRWRARPATATPAVPAAPVTPVGPTTTIVAAAVPSPSAGGAIGRTIWFSDQEIELVSLAITDRNVVLETRITNRGLRDDRTLRVMNDMPVTVDTPSGSVRLYPPVLPSVVIATPTPATIKGLAPSGFSLNGASIRFGDSGANAVTVPVPGEPTGSQPALFDFVRGSAPMTFQTATRTSQTEVTVSRSLLRPQIRPGTKGKWDLQLELTITVGSANIGANVEPALFAFNGIGTTCCTDLPSVIATLPAGATVTGWLNYTLPAKPGPTAVLSLIKGGSGTVSLTLNGV